MHDCNDLDKIRAWAISDSEWEVGKPALADAIIDLAIDRRIASNSAQTVFETVEKALLQSGLLLLIKSGGSVRFSSRFLVPW